MSSVTASPGTLSSQNFSGGANWTNPSNAASSNNSYATSSTKTDKLRATNFGFDLPATATITGILVEVEGFGDGAMSCRAQLRKASGAVGTIIDETAIHFEEQYDGFGGTTELWGTTWAVSDVENSAFGVDFWIPQTFDAGGNPQSLDVSVDHIRITVHYTDPPTVTGVSPSSGAVAGGTSVTLTGTNFTGATAVKFGTSNATSVVVVNSTSITCASPAGTAGSTVDVTVTTADGTSATNASAKFTYSSTVTITSITPATGTRLGGTAVTIAGTGFATGATVTIGGAAATGVSVTGTTQIDCTTPAGTVGTATVVVTVGTSSASLTNGYTYTGVTHTKSLTATMGAITGALLPAFAKDNIVKLVKGGSVVGDSKAATAGWTGTEQYIQYGGSTDLWGTSWTAADINAADFGAVLSAVVGAGVAKVDHVRITVYYEITGAADPTSMLATLKIDSTRTIATPQIYKLPRSGMTIANDPNIPKHRDDATLYTSRFYEPVRNVEKVWRNVDFWLDYDPEETNTPGFEVWASVEDGTAFQLVDDADDEVTFRDSGFHQAFFPKTASSVGKYAQLQLKVPAVSGTEQDVAVSVRDMVLHGSFRPLGGEMFRWTLVLGEGEFEDQTKMRRTIRKQRDALRALAGLDQDNKPTAPIPFRDPLGNTGYCEVRHVEFREVMFKGIEVPTLVAFVDCRVVKYA